MHDGGMAGRSWADAVARWQRAGVGKSRTTLRDELRLLKICASWDPLPVSAVDAVAIADLVDARLRAGMGQRSLNRLLEVVRAVLRSAARWRWIETAPDIVMLPTPAKRLRWLHAHEARLLLAELPPHQRVMVAFTLETGLRQSNVLQLEWSQVDLAARVAWIHADQAKGRRSIPVPLTDTAVALLKRQQGQDERYVFTYRGRPIRHIKTAWKAALKRAGIERFRWHDLRHTWASWHAQNGTPLHILQELGGWSSFSMVQNYAHLSVEHLRPHVDRFQVARQRDLCAR